MIIKFTIYRTQDLTFSVLSRYDIKTRNDDMTTENSSLLEIEVSIVLIVFRSKVMTIVKSVIFAKSIRSFTIKNAFQK